MSRSQLSSSPHTTRYEIDPFQDQMVAMSYLPAIELGRRRRRVLADQPSAADTPEDLEHRRRDRRRTRMPGKEEDESMSEPLKTGEIVSTCVRTRDRQIDQQYTFQLAFINPLFDPIQIRLTASSQRDPHATCVVFVPVPHFTVNALKDAWAYDEEEEEEHGSEGHSEEGSSTFSGPTKSSISGPGTMGKKSRLSVLGGLGDRRKKDHGVERRGNISKVGIEVEILPGATGSVEVSTSSTVSAVKADVD
jgi:dynactin-4